MNEFTAALGGYAPAFARAAAFSATMPLAGSGLIPRTLRAVFALVLTPVIAAHASLTGPHRLDGAASAIAENALLGAAFGISAAAVASAAAAAGGFADAALGSQLIGRPELFAGGGAFSRIYSLGFACVFLASGSFTRLCERFVASSSIAGAIPWQHFAVAVAQRACEAALVLAAPAVSAQVTATVVTAFIARAAPRVNGMMLASPLVAALLLAVLVAAAPLELRGLAALARAAASIPYP